MSPEINPEMEFQKKLHRMVKEQVVEGGVGALPAKLILQTELSWVSTVLQNTVTLQGMLESWMDNFRKNLDESTKGLDISLLNGKGKDNDCIVIGAGPSVKSENLSLLKDFKGTIICVNKTFKPLLECEVYPDICLALHTTEEVEKQFDLEVQQGYYEKDRVAFILPSTIHPKVANRIIDDLGGNVFWFNPKVPEFNVENINHFMEMMNQKPVLDTGGNVGIMAVVLAKLMGFKRVGLLGMEHCMTPSKDWSLEQALGYKYEFDPRDGDFYAIPPGFQVYLEALAAYIREMVADKVDVVNLTAKGPLYVRRDTVLRYQKMEEFINETHIL